MEDIRSYPPASIPGKRFVFPDDAVQLGLELARTDDHWATARREQARERTIFQG